MPYLLTRRAGCLAIVALLAGCAQQPVGEPTGVESPAIVAPRAAPPASPVYDILVGEIAAQRDDFVTAFERYLAVARSQGDPRLAERATQFALYGRNEEGGLEAARLWLELDPDNPQVYRILANLELRRGRVDAGMEHLERYVRDADDRAEALRQVSAILVRMPDKAIALEAAGRLAAANGDDADARFVHGVVARHAARLELAAREFASAVALRPEWSRARIQLAQVLVALERNEAALEMLAAGVEANPDDRELRLAYARMLMGNGRTAEARGQFQEIAASHPGDADVLYALALLSLELAQYEDAERYLHRLRETEARADEALFFLGRLESQRGNFAAALEWYRQVDGGDYAVEAHVQAAAALAGLGRLADALAEVQMLRESEPELRERLFLVEAELLIDADLLDAAMTFYAEALDDLPESSELRYARAMLAERVGRLDLLESDLQLLLQREPDNASALNALGYTLADRTDRYLEALGYIQRALELRPEDAAIIDSMGWVQYRLGNLDTALNYLLDAYARSRDPEIAAHLGEVLWESGEVERARRVLIEAWAEHADNEVLRRVVERYRP